MQKDLKIYVHTYIDIFDGFFITIDEATDIRVCKYLGLIII